MITRSSLLLFLLIAYIHVASLAMQTVEGGSESSIVTLRKATSDESLQPAQEPQGSHTVKTTEHAFFRGLPETTTLRSNYVKSEIGQQQIISCLLNLPYVTTKEVTVTESTEQRSKNTKITHQLDIRNLENIFSREILETERPKITQQTKETERKQLSFVQRNPTTSILMALAIGASLPFVLPELIRRASL